MTAALTEDIVDAFIEGREEPEWVKERRRSAWQTYLETPMPSEPDSPTEKHYTNLARLDFSVFAPLNPSRRATPDPIGSGQTLPYSYALGDGVAVSLSSNTQPFRETVPKELERQGVVFTDLQTAVTEHRDLVKPRLMSVIKPSEHKLTALHAALWSGGVFLHVPKGVEVEIPVHAIHYTATPGNAVFLHTIVNLEEQARVSFVEGYASPQGGFQSYHSELVEVGLDAGAKLAFSSLQDWRDAAVDFSIKRASVYRDSQMYWSFATFGADLTILTVESVMKEPGAGARNLGILFGGGRQHIDVSANVVHEAPQTNSEIITNGALAETASSVFRGTIEIQQQARQSTSHLTGNALLLSEKARANSIPSLAIKTNDVRAKHGATVSHLDEERLFYLMSRGVEKAEAERMIVEGFFEPIIRQNPLPKVQGEFRRLLAERIEHAGY